MTKECKKILLVDDSEIDREVLKNILENDFEIMEAANGFDAMEIIPKMIDKLGAILLDVSMPVKNGFDVLREMEEKDLDKKVPIFLITAEATQDNVEKAAQHSVDEFVRKPFDRDEILRRLKSRLGVVATQEFTQADVRETKKYIAELEVVYNKYLTSYGKEGECYTRIADLMKILLREYARVSKTIDMDKDQIDLISKAAYFCDIGNMLLPTDYMIKGSRYDKFGNDIYQSHTVCGANLIRLNHSKQCEYFVEVCADMCLHHHERFDGGGFPQRVYGSNFSIYAQLCRLVNEFDSMFYKYNDHEELQFDFVVNELVQDKGLVRQELFSVLSACKSNILLYYNTIL